MHIDQGALLGIITILLSIFFTSNKTTSKIAVILERLENKIVRTNDKIDSVELRTNDKIDGALARIEYLESEARELREIINKHIKG